MKNRVSSEYFFSTDKSECEIKRHINIIQNELTAIHELDIKKRMEISDEDICKFCNLTKIGVKSQSKELRLSMPSTRTTIDTFRKKYLMNQIGKKTFHYYYSVVFCSTLLANPLAHLSILIQEHKLPATYPDSEKYGTQTPNKIYTSKHPLVKNRFILYRYTKKVLKSVRQFSKDMMMLNELLNTKKKTTKRGA